MLSYLVLPYKFLASKQAINFSPDIAIMIFKNIHKYILMFCCYLEVSLFYMKKGLGEKKTQNNTEKT